MSLPWVEKYRPKDRTELIGNKAAINGLMIFLKRWNSENDLKAALLLGPAGCGKTSSVYALANELGYTVSEFNASDTRKKSSIKELLGPAAKFVSLNNLTGKRIILMDEVDGLSGRYDRGGLSEFVKIVKTSKFPIVCTANDPESDKINKLIRSKYFRLFEFTRLDEFEIFELLLKITENEDMDIKEIELERIAAKSSGDIRAAINELESLVYGSSTDQLEERNKMQTMTSILNHLYRATSYKEARLVMNNAPSDYYKLLLHLFDETAAQCKSPDELALAYEQLAQADIFYQRIMRSQNWSLLKYFFDFIGPGVALARKNNQFKKINKLDKLPSAFIARGKAKRTLSRASKLAPKVAPQLHISKTKFIHNDYKIFKQIFKGPNASEIASWLNLDDDEIDILVKETGNNRLETEIDTARKKISKHRINRGKKEKSSSNFLLKYFEKIEEQEEISDDQSDEKNAEDKEESDEETDFKEQENEDQLSLDDFF